MSCGSGLCLVIVCVLARSASGDVPQLLNYQGKLTDAGGQPIDGSVTVGFGFYDAESDGNLLYAEEQTVTGAQGIFHVLIGSGSNRQGDFAAICASESVWLGIVVDPQAPEPQVMEPRQRIGCLRAQGRGGGRPRTADRRAGGSAPALLP